MKYIIIIALLAAIGCQPPPPQNAELDALRWGAQPDSATVINSVRSYMELRLIDPASALYRPEAPFALWYKSAAGRAVAGWGVVVNINSRNRMGGYAGWSQYLAFFDSSHAMAGMFDYRMAVMKRGHTWGQAQERYTPQERPFRP